MYIIEHWLKAKVAEFSIARLEFLYSICFILLIPYTLCPIRSTNRPLFPWNGPLKVIQSRNQNFYFHWKPRYKTRTRKPRTDISKHGYSVPDNGGHLVREERRFYRTNQISVGFDRRTDILREVWLIILASQGSYPLPFFFPLADLVMLLNTWLLCVSDIVRIKYLGTVWFISGQYFVICPTCASLIYSSKLVHH